MAASSEYNLNDCHDNRQVDRTSGILGASFTDLVQFHISTCWYSDSLTCGDLHVFQSDPSCFQQLFDEILS